MSEPEKLGCGCKICQEPLVIPPMDTPEVLEAKRKATDERYAYRRAVYAYQYPQHVGKSDDGGTRSIKRRK